MAHRYGPLSVRIAVHIAALLPLFLLVVSFILGRLTADPIREVQVWTGQSTLLLLVSSLTCTPLYILTGWSAVIGFRRTLGLYAFMYGCLHFMNLVGLDYQFNPSLLWADIAKKPYILLGFPAFLILLALALTSSGKAKRALGMYWKVLHRFVYLAGILGILHYLLATKVRMAGPFVYGGVFLSLLLFRIPGVNDIAERVLPWRKKKPLP
jgi:methionine sulfoxide reductase heme-binding subunit